MQAYMTQTKITNVTDRPIRLAKLSKYTKQIYFRVKRRKFKPVSLILLLKTFLLKPQQKPGKNTS